MVKSSDEIRNMICDSLERGDPIMNGIDTNDLLALISSNVKSYIKNMRTAKTHGGAIEIQCACNLFHIKIIVLNYKDMFGRIHEFVPLNNIFEKSINLTWASDHYTSL